MVTPALLRCLLAGRRSPLGAASAGPARPATRHCGSMRPSDGAARPTAVMAAVPPPPPPRLMPPSSRLAGLEQSPVTLTCAVCGGPGELVYGVNVRARALALAHDEGRPVGSSEALRREGH